MIKKIRVLAILLCAAVLLGVAACGGGGGGTATNDGGSSPASGGSTSASGGSSPASGGSSPESSGSSPASGGSAASGKDTLSVAISGDTGTLNWASISGDYGAICHLIQESMWTVKMLPDGGHEIMMLLAEDMEIIEENDELKWIIHLRKGVKFSNGNDFTASDVIFSVNQAREVGIFGISRTQEIDIDRTKILDDYTIEMYFTSYRFNQIELYSDFLIYDEESFELERASANPIGTGPYVLTEYIVNSHVFMERRDDYWGDAPAIKTFQFRVLTEPSQRVNGLATGNLDISTISTGDVSYVSGLPGYSMIERLPARWLSIGMNPTVGTLFHDVEARYAIVHAIDKQAIINVVYEGQAEISYGPSSRACWDYLPEYDNVHPTYSIGYDLELAKQYAERSGLMGKEVRVVTNGTAEHVQTAEMLQSMLKAIDVTVVIQNYDAAGYGDATRDPTMFEISVGQGSTPTMIYMAGFINNSRMSPVYGADDAWEWSAWWNDYAQQVYYMMDLDERHEGNMDLIRKYTEACFIYNICEFTQFTAVPDNLQNIYYGQNGSIMYRLLTF